MPLDNIKIDEDGCFSFGGENFVIDETVGERRPSDDFAFTIVKNRWYFEFYARLTSEFSPKSILEIGIFQGGSFVFLDKLFQPDLLAAVDITSKPVAPLVDYAKRNRGRFVNFATSQDDRAKLERIVYEQLEGRVDLVSDDASHQYERTKTTFEILFPLLTPGGVYVIEDWGWSHMPQFQSADALWSDKPALSNLLFEQLMLLASAPDYIKEIRVGQGAYAIIKSPNAGSLGDTVPWHEILSRGRQLQRI